MNNIFQSFIGPVNQTTHMTISGEHLSNQKIQLKSACKNLDVLKEPAG